MFFSFVFFFKIDFHTVSNQICNKALSNKALCQHGLDEHITNIYLYLQIYRKIANSGDYDLNPFRFWDRLKQDPSPHV